MADEAAVQPNEEAANHHAAVAPKGQDTGGQPTAATLDQAARQGGGRADPKHPHLFHLAGAAGSDDAGGSLQGAIAANWSILDGRQDSIYLARLKPGGIRVPGS